MTARYKSKEFNWIKVVERKNSPLFLNFICNGVSDEYTEKVLGTKLGYDFYVYLDGEVYITAESSKNIDLKFSSAITGHELERLNEFLEKWNIEARGLLDESEKSREYIKSDNDRIAKAFSEITEKFYRLSTSLMLAVPVEKYLEEQIRRFLKNRQRRNINTELLILTHSDKKNENELENESLNNIASIIEKEKITLDNSNSKVDALIAEHIEKYGWLGTDRFFNKEWSKQDILERLADKLKGGLAKSSVLDEKELLHELSLSPAEQEIINIAKEYAYFRTFRMNIFMKSSYQIRELLLEISKRLGVKFMDVIYMTPQEIIDCLNNKISIPKDEINCRLEEYGYYIKDNKNKTLSGNDYSIFKEKYFSNITNLYGSELQGTIANAGYAKGIVKILKSTLDLSKVNYGDILVAPMTIPSFVPAMERAAAFITDEGGILCHAAIVAREMRKPCIIGTKFATKYLKDGDLVEVDAIKGFVRKIT
jgi:pyruvate,water dikinase